jgi:hypothetical protein
MTTAGNQLHLLLARIHILGSTTMMVGSLVNFFVLNKAATKALAWITLPATLPIFIMTGRMWRYWKGNAARKLFVSGLCVGGAINMALAYDHLSTGQPRLLNVVLGPMRLETALFVSCLGGLVLNGKRFSPRFGLDGTSIGQAWKYLSANPPLGMGLVEPIGASMVLVDRYRLKW